MTFLRPKATDRGVCTAVVVCIRRESKPAFILHASMPDESKPVSVSVCMWVATHAIVADDVHAARGLLAAGGTAAQQPDDNGVPPARFIHAV